MPGRDGGSAPQPRRRVLRLRREFFDHLAAGRKTVEVRVCDPEREGIAPGEQILFTCESQEVLAEVVRVARYRDFHSLLAAEPIGRINPGLTREQQLAVLREIYPPAKEALGALAIRITVLRQT
ncbi:ASCH domain-containing protein [Longispora albida]|uniref:ASCH domain-containing protein n=1 Tax=Longispora albida TaxID=203523 RepID=UPI000477CC5A|nr:ASCH domain-containing protein [Longispora albida]